jgi:peptide/nickel transport system permease protein
VDALAEEFVRGARAKGAATRRVLLHHVLRRTGSSLCAVLGLLFPTLVGGAALVEVVFGWPGAGATLVSAVGGRDYPVVIALVLVGSLAVCAGSALADAGAVLANPAMAEES